MDDATNEHYSMFFVDEEGTQSSFRGVREVIESHGLFSAFYSDRGSHYWTTPEAGGKVDKINHTQFGRAMKQLGIGMIAAYSPEARGRSERAFATHQGRLPKELALAGITNMDAANRYLLDVYRPAFNAEFAQPPLEVCSAFVRFEGLTLQIPSDRHRCHYVKAKVHVHRYQDGTLAVFHGPRQLAVYDVQGTYKQPEIKDAA